MVHPDKCSHVRAKEAFEVLNSANNDLQSEERRREVIHVLNMAKGEGTSHLSSPNRPPGRCQSGRMVR